VTVLAELHGQPFDLDALARYFPTGNPRILVDDESTFLVIDDLDDVFTEAGPMVEIAKEHLARLNGWAILADAGYRTVDDLLAIVGKADRLSWSQLYKVFEIVRDAVGGGRAGLVATLDDEGRPERVYRVCRPPRRLGHSRGPPRQRIWRAAQAHCDARRSADVHPGPRPQVARIAALIAQHGAERDRHAARSDPLASSV
jgi:hypothetical protein